jgi:ABC transporter with metal-binding/Fe-S-binding domain ATP-binding protein
MNDAAGEWVGLFSGGKDSSWALYRALEAGLDVSRLVTVHPPGDSYMYHVPATRLAGLAAESVGLPLVEVEPDADSFPGDGDGDGEIDSGERGDAELEPLEAALAELAAELDGGLAGVTVGAVESSFQADRVEGMADRLDCEVFAPLWHEDPYDLLDAMLEAGFEILIVRVAAYGLDESWLGRTIDEAAVADLRELDEQYGVHPMGEGGEFETLVVDAPHMDRRIELDWEREWAGDRGSLAITDARLG